MKMFSPNLLVAELELPQNNGVKLPKIQAIHRQRLLTNKTLNSGKRQSNEWHVARIKTIKNKTNKVYKIEEDNGGVLK